MWQWQSNLAAGGEVLEKARLEGNVQDLGDTVKRLMEQLTAQNSALEQLQAALVEEREQKGQVQARLDESQEATLGAAAQNANLVQKLDAQNNTLNETQLVLLEYKQKYGELES